MRAPRNLSARAPRRPWPLAPNSSGWTRSDHGAADRPSALAGQEIDREPTSRLLRERADVETRARRIGTCGIRCREACAAPRVLLTTLALGDTLGCHTAARTHVDPPRIAIDPQPSPSASPVAALRSRWPPHVWCVSPTSPTTHRLPHTTADHRRGARCKLRSAPTGPDSDNTFLRGGESWRSAAYAEARYCFSYSLVSSVIRSKSEKSSAIFADQ